MNRKLEAIKRSALSHILTVWKADDQQGQIAGFRCSVTWLPAALKLAEMDFLDRCKLADATTL